MVVKRYRLPRSDQRDLAARNQEVLEALGIALAEATPRE
jgi:hypothetical protein